MTSRILAAVAGLAALVAAVALGTDPPNRDLGEVTLASATAAPTPDDDPSVAAIRTSRSEASAATPPATTGPRSTTTPIARPTPDAVPSPTPDAVDELAPTVAAPTRPARLAELAVAQPAAPVILRLPTLDVTASIVPVGVQDDGQMEVPEDVDEAGWYRHGPAPGGAGNTILAGHVDDREQGLGIFHRLVDLQVGDEVVVGLADDTTTSWRVTGRQLVDKDALPVDDLFNREGIPQLVLVTCGGEFDGSARSYRSNVVVVAQRV